MTVRRLESDDEDKFWEAWIKDGVIFCYKFGKRGSNGHIKLKKFKSAAEAQAELDEQLQKKLDEGYEEIGGEDSEDEESEEAASERPVAAAKKKAAPAKPAKKKKDEDEDEEKEDEDDEDDEEDEDDDDDDDEEEEEEEDDEDEEEEDEDEDDDDDDDDEDEEEEEEKPEDVAAKPTASAPAEDAEESDDEDSEEDEEEEEEEATAKDDSAEEESEDEEKEESDDDDESEEEEEEEETAAKADDDESEDESDDSEEEEEEEEEKEEEADEDEDDDDEEKAVAKPRRAAKAAPAPAPVAVVVEEPPPPPEPPSLPKRIAPLAEKPAPEMIENAERAFEALAKVAGKRSWQVAQRARAARRALERLGGIDPEKGALSASFLPLMDLVIAPKKRLPLELALGLLWEIDASAYERIVTRWRSKMLGKSSVSGSIAVLAAAFEACHDPEIALQAGAALIDRKLPEKAWKKRFDKVRPFLEEALHHKRSNLESFLKKMRAAAAEDDLIVRARIDAASQESEARAA